tara:strand:+ start:3880 stop:4866 length:987 start_codon:yes stop_codon:yes gene_type:complete
MSLISGATTSYTRSTSPNNVIEEDVSDIIYNISPTDTPFMEMIGTRDVGNTNFEWLLESLPAPDSTTAVLEGNEFSADTAINQTRTSNVCQISVRTAQTTGTQAATSNYGFAQEHAHQLALAGRILKNNVEAALVSNNPKVAGGSSTARQTRGLEHWIVTNDDRGPGSSTAGAQAASETAAMTDADATRAFTETLLSSTMQTAFAAGAEPSVMMCGPFNKRAISEMTGRGGTQVQVTPEMVTSNVTIYASDFGDLRVVVNRKQRDRTVFLIDPEYFKVAYLRPFTQQEISKIGDAERSQILVEYGLESSQEAASAAIFDLNTSGTPGS